MARCCEKPGDSENARTYYRLAAGATAHSVPATLARQFALRKLQSGGG